MVSRFSGGTGRRGEAPVSSSGPQMVPPSDSLTPSSTPTIPSVRDPCRPLSEAALSFFSMRPSNQLMHPSRNTFARRSRSRPMTSEVLPRPCFGGRTSLCPPSWPRPVGKRIQCSRTTPAGHPEDGGGRFCPGPHRRCRRCGDLGPWSPAPKLSLVVPSCITAPYDGLGYIGRRYRLHLAPTAYPSGHGHLGL